MESSDLSPLVKGDSSHGDVNAYATRCLRLNTLSRVQEDLSLERSIRLSLDPPLRLGMMRHSQYFRRDGW